MMLLLLLISSLFGYGSGYYVMPEVVSIVESPVDTVVCEGCRLELTCTILKQDTAANLSQPRIKWMVNGTDATLAQTNFNTIQNSTDIISSFIISTAHLEHQGSYRCVVVDGNATTHCHSNTPPRHPCVPLVTISREARVKVLDNTTMSERNSNQYNSSTPCNAVSSHKETMFIDPELVTICIELSCSVDVECISDITWYHNGEEISTASEVCGNASQLYGVYQCFVSYNGGHSVEASITRVLPHGLTNPPSEPLIVIVPRAYENVFLAGVYIEWTPPFFTGNLSNDVLQYQVTYDRATTLSNDSWTVIFVVTGFIEVHIAVINSVENISENSPARLYDVKNNCIHQARFPPVLTLSCTDGGFSLSWRDSPRNELYNDYSLSRLYYAQSYCDDATLQEPVEPRNLTSPIVRSDLYEVGTQCWFSVAATLPITNNLQCNYSNVYNPGDDCYRYCYDPGLIEYAPWQYCEVTGTLHFENDTVAYFVQEDENGTIELQVCVVAKGSGFKVNIRTEDITATGGRDYSVINETLLFSKSVRKHCVNVSIFNDAILEDPETFLIVLSGVNSSLVNITTDSATIEISDDDSVTANVTVSSQVIAEGDPPLRVCVELPVIEKSVTLYVTTYNISAEIGEDFVTDEDQLTFTPTSSTTQCVNITIIDDDLLETMENFTVMLSTSNTSRVVISEEWFEIQIKDNDEVNVSLSETSFSVSEETESPLRVCASVSGSLGRSVSIGIVAVDETAVGGGDYVLVESQLHFNASHYNDCISIDIINDDVLEDSERFTVMLRGADSENVRVSNQPATVEIEDNDYITVSLLATSFNPTEPLDGETPLNVCVEITGNFTRNESVVVFIEATEGSASSGSDYTASTGDNARFIFHQDGPAMLCSDSIISVRGDDIIEYEEYFNISLSLPSSENLESVRYGDPSHSRVTIQDSPHNRVEITFDQSTYEVQPQSNVIISVELSTTLQLERDINVLVKFVELTALAGRDYIPQQNEILLVFNDTVRTAQFAVEIVGNTNDRVFSVYTEGGTYFNTSSSKIRIIEKDNANIETALLGSSLAFVATLIVAGGIIAVTVILLVKCGAFTKRDNDYLDGKEFEGWDSIPVEPDRRGPIETKDEDRETVINFEFYGIEITPSTSMVMDYRDAIIIDEQRHSVVHEKREEEAPLQDPISQELSCESTRKNEHVLVSPRRKMSGSSTSGTDSSSSRPYVQANYENPICQCPHCVSQRLGGRREQLQEGAFLDVNEANQLPKAPVKYMNTLTIPETDNEEILQGELKSTTVVNSPSEHSVSLLDAIPLSLMNDTINHALCEKHKLAVEETELAVCSLEVEDALPQVSVDTSVGCGRASSDDPS